MDNYEIIESDNNINLPDFKLMNNNNDNNNDNNENKYTNTLNLNELFNKNSNIFNFDYKHLNYKNSLFLILGLYIVFKIFK